MTQHRITDDLDALLGVLPANIRHAVEQANNSDYLLEVILDLGRVPTARFVENEVILSNKELTRAELDHVLERVGEFDTDNRSGIERTLHRISAIRNRRGAVVGLTLRVGRAVYGTVDIIQDIIESGKSALILGRPGVGKTTLLRESARILAENKRVVIVDTSNEIGGDGDVPHPAVGKARRMQVREPMLQHEVMIEAVENHNPEVIVIDEIGRELEALAARTIAERGVQLIGTAHGQTLDNLLLNPTLSDLVGGIEAVTLSDEEARRRGTQKTVLERRAPPTFDVLIEIQHRDQFAIHTDIMSAVDSLLRDAAILPEVRTRDAEGKIQIQKSTPATKTKADVKPARRGLRSATASEEPTPSFDAPVATSRITPTVGAALQTVRVFAYGVARNRLMQGAKRLGVPAVVVRDVSEADALVGGFCLWGVYAGYMSWTLEQNGTETTGHVVRLEESSNGDGGCCVYSPVIEFEASGQTWTFESNNASSPPAYEVGEAVPVLYDPADPNTAQIDHWAERWLMPVILVPAMLLTALILNFFLGRAFWRNELT